MARRRRYNRKRRRGSFAFLYKLLAFVLICGAIGLALAMFFKIEDIEISGNSRYSKEQIVAAAEVKPGDNLFLLNKYDAAARITMRYMDRFDVQFLWDADFDYKLDYLAAVVDKLEANEKGTIDMTQEGKASFIPA